MPTTSTAAQRVSAALLTLIGLGPTSRARHAKRIDAGASVVEWVIILAVIAVLAVGLTTAIEPGVKARTEKIGSSLGGGGE